jgi:hypothetical protein
MIAYHVLVSGYLAIVIVCAAIIALGRWLGE